LNRMKYQSLFLIFMIPVILILGLHDCFRIENVDLKFIIGCVLTLTFVTILCYLNLKGFLELRGINLGTDSILESVRKVTEFKRLFIRKRKFNLMAFPMFFVGILFIAWKSFDFGSNILFILLGVSAVSLALGYKQLKMYSGKIEELQKEILDLNEYAE